MKKIVSLFVALCMVFTMIPALAETAVDQAILGTSVLNGSKNRRSIRYDRTAHFHRYELHA